MQNINIIENYNASKKDNSKIFHSFFHNFYFSYHYMLIESCSF